MQLGLLVVLLLAAAPGGRAPLRLQLDQCPNIDRATVSRVVTMELAAAPADERLDRALTTANAQCADGRVRLTVEDPVTGKTVTRALDLEDQPRGLRSRLLGLAISELVLASWIELRLTPGPPSRTDALTRPEARREAAAIAERRLQIVSPTWAPPRWEIVVGPAVRRFSSGLLMVGLSATARHWLDQHPAAGVGLEMEGSYGEKSVTGVARADATSLSLAPCLLMRSAFGPVVVAASAGWRVGLAQLSADPASDLRSGRTGWRGWTGPLLAVDLSVPLSHSLLLRAAGESGYVLVPAHGRLDGAPVIELDGAWLSGVLSLGAKF